MAVHGVPGRQEASGELRAVPVPFDARHTSPPARLLRQHRGWLSAAEGVRTALRHRERTQVRRVGRQVPQRSPPVEDARHSAVHLHDDAQPLRDQRDEGVRLGRRRNGGQAALTHGRLSLQCEMKSARSLAGSSQWSVVEMLGRGGVSGVGSGQGLHDRRRPSCQLEGLTRPTAGVGPRSPAAAVGSPRTRDTARGRHLAALGPQTVRTMLTEDPKRRWSTEAVLPGEGPEAPCPRQPTALLNRVSLVRIQSGPPHEGPRPRRSPSGSTAVTGSSASAVRTWSAASAGRGGARSTRHGGRSRRAWPASRHGSGPEEAHRSQVEGSGRRALELLQVVRVDALPLTLGGMSVTNTPQRPTPSWPTWTYSRAWSRALCRPSARRTSSRRASAAASAAALELPGPGQADVSSFSFSSGSRCFSQALKGAEVRPWTTTDPVMAKVAYRKTSWLPV